MYEEDCVLIESISVKDVDLISAKSSVEVVELKIYSAKLSGLLINDFHNFLMILNFLCNLFIFHFKKELILVNGQM